MVLWQFISYFYKYIFKTKTRQRLIFLALAGLFLSSFSLLVLQSVMGGLQNNVIERSIRVNGAGIVSLRGKLQQDWKIILKELKDYKIEAYPEYEIEVLLKSEDIYLPAIIHGIDFNEHIPSFLKGKDIKGVILGSDLAMNLKVGPYDQIELISPAHTFNILGEIPRQVSEFAKDIVTTHASNVDGTHGWTRLSLIHNLIRSRGVNRLRVTSVDGVVHPIDVNFKEVEKYLTKKYGDQISIQTWGERNSSLVWALKLETNAMIFLFITMTLLVAISITSSFLVFFDKIKFDFASLWILGLEKEKLKRGTIFFLHSISILIVLLGIGTSLVFLFLLHNYGMEIMPEIFVDRKLPVMISAKGLLISFFVPYFIAITFSLYSFKNFMKEESNYLKLIRRMY